MSRFTAEYKTIVKVFNNYSIHLNFFPKSTYAAILGWKTDVCIRKIYITLHVHLYNIPK